MADLHVERSDGIVRLGLNRPARKNALTPEMYVALAREIDDANERDDVRAVVIHGDESAFCSGNDIGNFAEAGDKADIRPASDESKERPSAAFMRSVAKLDKPLVAAVNGPAVGIGATMLLHCDVVIAGSNAFLMFPFVKLGLCPEFASSLLLPAIVGSQRAAKLMLLSERCQAADALALGLVAEVVAPAESLPRALAIAAQLCALPGDALATTRRLTRPPREQVLARIAQEATEFVRLLTSPDAQAAFAAFQGGRKG